MQNVAACQQIDKTEPTRLTLQTKYVYSARQLQHPKKVYVGTCSVRSGVILVHRIVHRQSCTAGAHVRRVKHDVQQT